MLVNDMRELSVRGLNPAHHFSRQHALCPKALGRILAGPPRVGVVTARVKIEGRVTRLRPRMDRQVRLGDHHDAGDAVGLKAVESYFKDLGVRLTGGRDHRLVDAIDVRKRFAIASGQLADNMSPACIQFLLFSSALAGKSHLQARRLARAVHLRPRPIDEFIAGML
jgi:hypothetical protein